MEEDEGEDVESHRKGIFAANVGLGGDLDWRLCKKTKRISTLAGM
jgi:hypothetical protein